MTLEEMAAQWERMGERFDGLYHGLSPAVRSAIQKALSEWQDFYYGGVRDTSQITVWGNALGKADHMLNQAAALGVKHTAAQNAQPIAAAKLGVTFVSGTGQADPFATVNFPAPKWYWLALPAIPALWLLFRSNNRR